MFGRHLCRRALCTLPQQPVLSSVAGEHITVTLGSSPVHRLSVVEVAPGIKGLVTNLRSKPLEDPKADVWLLQSSSVVSPSVDAEAKPSYVFVPFGSKCIGRVLDGSGQPIDGKGPLSSLTVPLQTSIPVPGPAQRTPVTQCWQSGYKAIDAFYPLKHGEFTVVAGEKELNHHDVALSATMHALLSARGSVGVLCFVGVSRKALKQAVAQLSLAGLDTRVTVIAATEEDPLALRYLAPFTAATIASRFRDEGRHCFVLYDSLSAHFEVSRQLSGDVGNAEFTAQHESLLEACAQMSDAKSGGSLTAIGVVDFANTGSASSAADRRRNATMKNLVSLADNRVVLSSKEARKGVHLPLDPEDIAARTGHASQGPAMCYYVNAAKLQYLQLQEVATNAVAAKAYGIDPEADKDAALDAFAKFNVLLFPSAGMLARLQHVDTLEGSAALTVEYLAAAASGKPLSRGDIPVEPELAPVAVREDVPPPVPAVPASPGAQERDSRLQSKMTAEQLQALQAVRALRASKASISSKFAASIKRAPTTTSPTVPATGVPKSTTPASFTVSLSKPVAVDAPSPAKHKAQRSGSKEELFLTLVLLCHDLLSEVPLNRLQDFTRELYHVLMAMPAPTGDGSLLSAAFRSVPIHSLFNMPLPTVAETASVETLAAAGVVWSGLADVIEAFTADFLDETPRF